MDLCIHVIHEVSLGPELLQFLNSLQKHSSKPSSPKIPTYEEIEKEILEYEESKKHIPQVVSAPPPSEIAPNPSEINPNPSEQDAHPKRAKEGKSNTPISSESAVKLRVNSSVFNPVFTAIEGTKLSYAVVEDDVVIHYFSSKTYASIEKINSLAQLENGDLKKGIIDYLGGMHAKSNKINALKQFVGCVRDGIVKLSSEEAPAAATPIPHNIPPTMSRNELRRRGLL